MICPRCQQQAPTIVRGARAYCTACGAPRSLLDDTPVNVAGQPSKIGGSVAHVLGWLVLIGGSLIGLTIGGLVQAIIAGTIVGWILGGFVVGMSVLFGLFLILGGRMLQKSGTDRERGAHEQAVSAIARRRGGSVTPAELAQAVSIREDEADALLTAMAKRPDGHVSLEVDDDGTLRYYVHEGGKRRVAPGGGMRVSTGARIGEAGASDALAEEEMASEEELKGKGRARR
jgi:hypothetical protein